MATELCCQKLMQPIQLSVWQNECLLCIKNCVRSVEGHESGMTKELTPKEVTVLQKDDVLASVCSSVQHSLSMCEMDLAIPMSNPNGRHC